MRESKPKSEVIKIVVEAGDEGIRLDLFLAEKLASTRSQIKRLIDQELVIVNDQVVKAGYALKNSDQIIIWICESESLELEPQNIRLEIVYQDNDLAVINKPASLVVHPGTDNESNTLVNALLYHFDNLSSIGGDFRPGVVHRLDKDTTGLLVIAKNDATHLNLANQFKEHAVKRRYLALVHGVVTVDHGKVEAPIGRNQIQRTSMAITTKGRDAVTEFRVRERFDSGYTLLECELHTGRTHQIRVHLAGINHPVVGDARYGRKEGNLRSQRQMLHAFFLGFSHPCNGKWMEFQIDLPEDFQKALALAGGSEVEEV